MESQSAPIDSRESQGKLWSPRRLINREFPSLVTHKEGKRVARAITDSNSDNQALDEETEKRRIIEGVEELLNTSAQTRYYYYYPYFRIRRISKRTYDNKLSQPFSNYANDYDKFPTVA